MKRYLAIAAAILVIPQTTFAQGEDSTFYERDLSVIGTLLDGGFDNANQAYFDGRANKATKHRRIHAEINRVDAPALGEYVFASTLYWDNDEALHAGDFLWVLSPHAESASVRMRSWRLEEQLAADSMLSGESLAELQSCDLYWRREAAQFRASAAAECDLLVHPELVLSEKQLWIAWSGTGADYKLHRVRMFECHADIPGVGGGRDIPYDRYEGFRIHDQGGAVWFETKDKRKLGISLFLVDWPLNNYKGIFTRDSFVIYVSEEIDGDRKEHGYAFTVPEADRIGINLKWVLASCYMKSNRFETPHM